MRGAVKKLVASLALACLLACAALGAQSVPGAVLDARQSTVRVLAAVSYTHLDVYKRQLWERSGHWDHYKKNMYTTVIDDTDFAIKPMNCPGGMLVYQTRCV